MRCFVQAICAGFLVFAATPNLAAAAEAAVTIAVKSSPAAFALALVAGNSSRRATRGEVRTDSTSVFTSPAR